MYQIRFRLGLRPRAPWGSLQRYPRPPSWISGPTSKGTSHERNVRPFVKHVNCDKMKKISAHIFIPYERSIILVFRHKELVGDAPLYLKFWAKLIPFRGKHLLQSIFARSASL